MTNESTRLVRKCPKYEDFPDYCSFKCELGWDAPTRAQCYRCGYDEGWKEGREEGIQEAVDDMEDAKESGRESYD